MARRNIYEDRLNRIRDLRQAKDKSKLIDLAVQMGKQVNQRFYRLEKAGIGEKESAYRYAQIETGKEKPRYTISRNVLENMTDVELYDQLLDLNAKVRSKSSTISGIEELIENRLERAREEIKERLDIDIDRDKFDEFLRHGGGELLNRKQIDSDQIIEDFDKYVINGNISINEFVDTLNSYSEKQGSDYGSVIRNLNRLSRKKRARG